MKVATRHILHSVTVLLIGLLLVGCDQESTVAKQTITGNQISGKELIIEVNELASNSTGASNPVSDVEIRLFDSRENLIIEMNEVRKMTTDSAGVAIFKSMSSGYYYVLADHSSLGRLEDGANIPVGAVKSYIELIYF